MSQNMKMSSSGKIENDTVLPYSFSIRNSIKESWSRVSGFKATAIGAFVIVLLFQFVLALILIYGFGLNVMEQPTVPNPSTIQDWSKILAPGISNWIIFLVSFPIFYGLYFLGIKRSVNLPVKALMIFGAYRLYLRLLGVVILQCILWAIIVGLIALAVLFFFILSSFISITIIGIVMKAIGVIIGLLLLYFFIGLVIFTPYLVMDKKIGVFKSFKLSWRGFKQHGIKIIITFFIMSLIIFVSAIPLGIGLIWTIPLAIILFGVIYRTIFGVSVNKP